MPEDVQEEKEVELTDTDISEAGGETDLSAEEKTQETGSEDSEKTEDKVEEKPSLDKELQQEQQLRANAMRRVAELETQRDEAKVQKEEKTGEGDPLEDIASLKADAKENKAVIDQARTNNERVAFDDFMTDMDKEHGSENRNEAIKYAKELSINAGFTLDNGDVPDTTTSFILLEKGYMRAKIAALEKKKGGNSQTIKGDDGRRSLGGSIKATVVSGDPDTVIEAMRKEGKFQNYY